MIIVSSITAWARDVHFINSFQFETFCKVFWIQAKLIIMLSRCWITFSIIIQQLSRVVSSSLDIFCTSSRSKFGMRTLREHNVKNAVIYYRYNGTFPNSSLQGELYETLRIVFRYQMMERIVTLQALLLLGPTIYFINIAGIEKLRYFWHLLYLMGIILIFSGLSVGQGFI